MLAPSVPSSLGMDASLPSSVPSLPMDRSASNGGISGLGVADPASDSDLPPDVGADAELLVAEGSASFSGMSWHGMAEPGSLDVDLPPDTDVLNAWDDVTDKVDRGRWAPGLALGGRPRSAEPGRSIVFNCRAPTARHRGIL